MSSSRPNVLEAPQEQRIRRRNSEFSIQGSKIISTTVLEEAIPVAEVTPERSRGEEIERWFRLYKSGAITEAEYEAEKEKLLKEL